MAVGTLLMLQLLSRAGAYPDITGHGTPGCEPHAWHVSHVSWHPPAYFSPLRALHRFQVEETVLDKLKITFENSTDFFGRIVVYHLGVLGERL